jgi:Leucine-rich repeat (LRR) protein
VLRLDSNAITTLPANLFETLPNLKSLSLMKNNLQHFPHYWAPHLVELVLSENKLAEFLPSPNINQNFLSLEILDLRQNQLQQAPFISSALKLKRITLQQNRIQALHSAQFALCGVMEDVLCAKNIIEHIETGFFARMPNLKIIDLKENRLREFTQEHIGDTHPALDQIMLAYN